MYQFSISDDGTIGNHWWNGLLDKKKCILYLYSSTTISSHDCLRAQYVTTYVFNVQAEKENWVLCRKER